jgi:inorganic pyrophosphatase
MSPNNFLKCFIVFLQDICIKIFETDQCKSDFRFKDYNKFSSLQTGILQIIMDVLWTLKKLNPSVQLAEIESSFLVPDYEVSSFWDVKNWDSDVCNGGKKLAATVASSFVTLAHFFDWYKNTETVQKKSIVIILII